MHTLIIILHIIICIALILVDKQGANSIAVASGANHALSPRDVEGAATVIRSAAFLVLQLEIPLATVECAAKIAAAAGVPVILDPAPAPDGPLPDKLMRCLTYIKPNETEAERLTGIRVVDERSAQAAADKLIAAGAQHAVVTLGEKGALLALAPGDACFVAGKKVQAVDTTAAGDAFSGALACALARGDKPADAVRFANLAAALSVTRMGAQPSLPTADEVRAFGG